MDIFQFNTYVLRPVLQVTGTWTVAAEQQVLGTFVHESGGLRYIKQRDGGPALGFLQMEPATHKDIWDSYLRYKPHLANSIKGASGIALSHSVDPIMLTFNLRYQVCMCRIHYLRRPEPLPEANDILAQAKYWKDYYNTHKGKGTVEDYVRSWEHYVKQIR